MPDKSLDYLPLKLNLFKDKYLFQPLKSSGHQIQKIISKKSEIIVTKEIPKRDSDENRIIQYPVGSYKLILKRLHKLLMRRSKFPQSVCGGIIDKNLFNMVNSHCGQEAIYQIDLKDFFPNISSNRIYSFFLSSNCSAQIAEILTELVSFENKLPQGFPTSPIIANLIAWKMDFDHENICSGHKLRRTRWIDDILISGRIKDLDPEIHKLEKSIVKNGYTINSKKKKYIRRGDRKKEMIAVGLDIRKHKPDVSQNVFNKIESMLIIFKEEGSAKVIELFEEEFPGKDIRQSLAGKIRFIAQYNQQKGSYLKKLFDQAE
jgi:hypothetical protein